MNTSRMSVFFFFKYQSTWHPQAFKLLIRSESGNSVMYIEGITWSCSIASEHINIMISIIQHTHFLPELFPFLCSPHKI